MLHAQRIAVVVPAYNEASLLARCLAAVPGYIDLVVVVDDASTDGTARVALQQRDRRLRVVSHPQNRGVGAAILTGYLEAREAGMDVAAVMAGDGQMHPDDLPGLLLPVLRGEADYVKGARLEWPGARQIVPPTRWLGIRALEVLTRWSTGLSALSDFQCGYTALRLSALDGLDLDRVYPRYGFPNDFLSHLATAGARIDERVVRPVYGDERSDLSIPRVIVPLLGIVARSWWRRRRSLMGRPVPGPVLAGASVARPPLAARSA
jgi:glycosyltransferase involved in cell wall biosynthesis